MAKVLILWLIKRSLLCHYVSRFLGSAAITPQHKSIVDRCTYNIYRKYISNNYEESRPHLLIYMIIFLNSLSLKQVSLHLQLNCLQKAHLILFAKQTNVDINSRFICYDILELGKQLMPIGMLVILDSILNRITANREKAEGHIFSLMKYI